MAFPRVPDLALKLAGYAVLTLGANSIIREHVVDITPIDGRSMHPTLSPNVHETGERDYVLWSMYQPSKGIHAGDLILFMSPNDPDKIVTKRVIATGGDTVILDPTRRPGYGKSYNELSSEETMTAQRWHSYGGKMMVPFGHVWVEGDNSKNSKDSNDYGPISKGLILGKAWMAVSPWKICFQKPWEGYKTKTEVLRGPEVLPLAWKDN